MKINQGDNLYFRLLADRIKYSAKVVSVDEDDLVLSVDENIHDISIGSSLVITTPSADCYGKVTSIEGKLIKLKMQSHCRREYFRVDDFIQVIAKRVINADIDNSSNIFQGNIETHSTDPQDVLTNHDIWKILINIDAKVNMILNEIRGRNDNINMAERKKVNISASGIRFTIRENINKGDKVEIKMLLPTNPQTELITCGEVVRVSDLGNGEHEVAIHFYDIKEDTREKIIQYTIERERELIRQKLMEK